VSKLIDGDTGQAVPLDARVEHIAGALAARGFAPGDVLALWAPNIPAWAGVAFGAMAAGGAVTGIHPAATDREVAAQLESSGASVLVTVPSLAGRAPGALVIGPELLEAPTAPVPPAPGPDTVALLPFSSGTTGLPKGVRLTHRNLNAAIRQIELALGLTDRDVVLAVPPFCHVMGFVVTLAAPLAAGATVVTLPRWDEAAIDRYGVTVLAVPPPLMAALARSPHDHPSLELIVSGGAPLAPAVQEAVAARFPHPAVAQGYGMTETAVAISGPDRRRPTPLGSVGTPGAGTEIRLVAGELWVRGPQVMTGYLNNESATKATIDADGWLHTGDIAEVDEDGYFTIVDRLKELIKYKGFQVPPAELEAILITHPAVADCAVIGVPDEEAGELPKAFVVCAGEVSDDEIMDYVADKVSPQKKIRLIERIEEIPKSASGKILRRQLK
jgi:acyl-CoA synthetase (AMP-forming)/AMP-acid ligase II